MGGAHHPLLGVLGVMSAKNTVMNLVILTTFLSFVFYRRANKERPAVRPAGGMGAPLFMVALSLFPILFCGVNGFLGEGAKAEERMPVLQGEVDTLRVSLPATDEPIGSVMDGLKELGRKESELDKLSRTPGIHHAGGFRVIAVIFGVFLALALLDMLGSVGKDPTVLGRT